jgi:hypothetical protein
MPTEAVEEHSAMAVTIDEMRVDTQKSTPAPSPPAPSAAKKESTNLRSEAELLKERALRLQAD